MSFRSCRRAFLRIPRRNVAYAYSKRSDKKEWSTAAKIALLALPAITFGLGTWQVFRLRAKEALIARMEQRTTADVVELPSALRFDDDELVALSRQLEYRRVHVRGEFLPGLDLHLSPRISADGQHGFHVITPLRRQADGAVLLVNRGWLPASLRLTPERIPLYLPHGIVDVVGFVRLSDRANMFVPTNNAAENRWFSVDIATMAAAVGNNALPILIDCKEIKPPATLDNLPLPGQTRISLPNDHMQYIVTWYSLTGFLLIFARGLFRK